MIRRPPLDPAARLQLMAGGDSLEAEILAEKAAALGRAGRAVEKALAALGQLPPGDERRMAAYSAAEAVQAFFIQRELMGQRSHAETIRQYDIPPEVLGKIGAKP